jgi:hypothetical protein
MSMPIQSIQRFDPTNCRRTGTYKINQKISAGGYGAVYNVTSNERKDLALKVELRNPNRNHFKLTMEIQVGSKWACHKQMILSNDFPFSGPGSSQESGGGQSQAFPNTLRPDAVQRQDVHCDDIAWRIVGGHQTKEAGSCVQVG